MDINVNLEKLKDRIKEQRKRKEYTQQQLGEKVQSTKQAVSHWEKGDRTPDIMTVLLLADIFDCSVSYLVGETDNPSRELLKSDYKGHKIEIEVEKTSKDALVMNVNNILDDLKNKIIDELKSQ